MSSKKLLICSPSLSLHGGVEAIVNSLCRNLYQFGWEPVLALARGKIFNNVDAYREANPDLPIVEIDGTKGTRSGRLEALEKTIRRVNPHIVVSARIFDAYEVVARLKQRAVFPRLAIAIRGYEPHYLYDAWLYKENIDLCIVDGDLLFAACVNWSGLQAARVVSIPGGVEPPRTQAVARKSCGILRIGYVGRLAQSDKRALDLITLIKALEETPLDYHLSIVGSGPDESRLRQGLATLVASGKVSFQGWKSHEELYQEIYPTLDCLVNFSPAEGVTISGREAMMHGVVPVMSQFLGIKAEGLYRHGFNALTFPVGDLSAAAININRLAKDTGLLEYLSTNAARSQTGKYTHTGAMRAWAEALDNCLECSPAIGPVPKLDKPADGRLTRMGLSPAMAQRIRDLFGREYEHTDPGSEWPTGSGMITGQAADEIMRFAVDYETRVDGNKNESFIETKGRGCHS